MGCPHEEATKMIQVHQKAPVLADLRYSNGYVDNPTTMFSEAVGTVLASCSCVFMSGKLSLREQAQKSPYI
jgi:hypothetical protein